MQNKFGLIIWSKDRAAQLDLLLRSIEKFCPNQFEIHVLFYASNPALFDGYSICRQSHKNVYFHFEFNFCRQTKEIISWFDYICLSTDDTIVISPFQLTEEHMANIDVFSLRLSPKSIIQEPFSGRLQPALTRFVDEGETICWDFRDYNPHENFGYPFGMDMHVYNRRYYELIKDLDFNKTNQMESYLTINCRNKINPFIRSFKEQKAFNCPVNNTSGSTLSDNSLPFNEANDKFLSGKRFNIDDLNGIKINGCHQCVNLELK